jgi:hypothetical protein
MTLGNRIAALTALALAAMIALQLAAAFRSGNADAGASTPASAGSAAPFALPPVATFAQVVQRPLFAPGRRPPRAVPAAVAAGPTPAPPAALSPPPAVDLVGIVRSGSFRTAILRKRNGPTRRLQEHGIIDDWSVDAIEESSIVLSNQGRTITLPLAKRGGAGLPAMGAWPGQAVPIATPPAPRTVPGSPTGRPAAPAVSQ